MDWALVTPGELSASLREVPWSQRPHGPLECMRGFSWPHGLSHLSPRWKCNLYYFRTNYSLVIILALIAALRQSLAGLVAVLLATLGSLSLNNTFCATINDRLAKLLRRISPRLAKQLQASGRSSSNLGAPSSKSMKRLTVCGIPRGLFVTVIWGVGGLLLFRSHQLLLSLAGFSAGHCNFEGELPSRKCMLYVEDWLKVSSRGSSSQEYLWCLCMPPSARPISKRDLPVQEMSSELSGVGTKLIRELTAVMITCCDNLLLWTSGFWSSCSPQICVDVAHASSAS